MLTLIVQAWKSWKPNRGAAVLAMIALAIGIGSTTAIYTIVNCALLRPVGYPDGERFAGIFSGANSDTHHFGSSTIGDMQTYQSRTHSFEFVSWFSFANKVLTAPGQPQTLSALEVLPDLVNGIGVQPLQGRWFGGEAVNGANSLVAVISYALWQRLGGGGNILNSSITLGGKPYTVIGIMPESFRLPYSSPISTGGSDVWIPLDHAGSRRGADWGGYFGYAKLKPGVRFATAEVDAKAVAAEIAREKPANHPDYTVVMKPLNDLFSEEIRATLMLLFQATGVLLLITCANIAGLLVARSVSRARETAIAVALGASNGRLAFQYFLEGLVVSLCGTVLGIFFALGLMRAILRLMGDSIPRASEVSLDWTGVAVAVLAALVTSALASIAPLWQAVRTMPAAVLTEGVRASAARRSRGLSQALVIGEIAIAFGLLGASSVLITRLNQTLAIHPGFDPANLLTFSLTPDAQAVAGRAKSIAYEHRLLEALERIPGVESAGFVNQIPLAGCCFSTAIYSLDGKNLTRESRLSLLTVSPGYWKAMKIPLKAGRFLNEQDTSIDGNQELIPVVLNQKAAAYYFPNQDPLGASARLGAADGNKMQVVGIAGTVRNDGLTGNPLPEIYLSGYTVPPNPMRFVVRSPLATETVTGEVRRAVANVNSGQPIERLRSMNEIIYASLSSARTASVLMTFFAVSALWMAILGVYGLSSYSVRQRTVEIGTRMALGATGKDVLEMVLRSSLKMAGLGLGLGAVLSLAAFWLLRADYPLNGVPVLSFLAPALIVLAVVAVATLVPAYRATRLTPLLAIRNQGSSGADNWKPDIDDSRPAPATTKLLSAFSEASRRSASYREAVHQALRSIADGIGAESALLLEAGGDAQLHPVDGTGGLPHITLPVRGLLSGKLNGFPGPLPVDAGDLDAARRWALETGAGHLAEIDALEKSQARLAIALRDKNGVNGMLLLGARKDAGKYNAAERSALESCGEHFSLMLQNGRLTERVVKEEKMRRDLELAVEVQKRLLPQRMPDSPIAKLSGLSIPARSVGGDYYDFLEVGGGKLGIAIADIAGKGVAAALVMSVVQASLRMIALEGETTLPQIANRMNRYLYRSTGTNSYATFFYGQIDEATGELRYVNAGHNPPYLVRASGEIEELPAGGTVIGLFPEMKYAEAAVKLQTGDVLIAFTDGVTEALNPEGEEYGEEQLKELIGKLRGLPVDEITPAISASLQNWIQHAEQYDDLTFLLLKVS